MSYGITVKFLDTLKNIPTTRKKHGLVCLILLPGEIDYLEQETPWFLAGVDIVYIAAPIGQEACLYWKRDE
jgi:hypothetical protein